MTSDKLSPMPKAERRLLYVLAGIQFTHTVDFMILMPIGPMLSRDLAIEMHQFGILVSSYTFAAAASGLLCALFIDRFERKRALLVLYSLFILATLACALAPGYWGLLAARCLAGAFGGVIGAIVSIVVGDQIPPERRGRAGGYLSASFAAATVAGVPLGLWLANHTGALTWRAPFVFVACISACFGLAAWKWLRPNPALALQAKAQGSLNGAWRAAWHRVRDVIQDPVHRWAMLLSCLLMYSAFSVIPYITIYATQNVHFPETMLPTMYLLGGTLTLFTSRWVGKKTDQWGKRKALMIFAPLTLIPILLVTHLGVVPAWAYLILSSAFFVMMNARMIPMMAMLNGAAKPEMRGTFMSLSASLQQGAMGLSTFVTGLIVSTNAAGDMVGYNYAGYIAVLGTAGAMWAASKVTQRG